MTDEQAARNKALDDCLAVVNYGRECGESDLRQIRNWIECLRTQSIDEFLKEMAED